MFKSRMSLLGATALVFTLATPAQAAPIYAPVPVANYITVGGLDWAWAAPCAAYGSSCGVVDMSYQSTQGWRFPTLAEFLARPTVGDFGPDASNFKCASAWFSTNYTHCDYGDPTYPSGSAVNGQGQPTGYLFDYGYGITSNGSDSLAETWVVRGALDGGAVPEPSTWAMMLAGFGAVGFAMRRRQKVSVSYA